MCMAVLEHPLLLLGGIVSQVPTGNQSEAFILQQKGAAIQDDLCLRLLQ